MIEIKPNIRYLSSCLHCESLLKCNGILWQGMVVCSESKCPNCAAEFIEEFPVAHAVIDPCQIDLKNGVVSDEECLRVWRWKPLLESLQNPQYEEIKIVKQVFKQCESVIILNCIDFLYGHSLLKLLNAQRHLEDNSEHGLVVIVPRCLSWMVPKGVAEVWTVDIPLKTGQSYYPSFNKFVQGELNKFSQVYISKAYSHPTRFDITKFTGVPRHDFGKEEFKITFVWREDRSWCNSLLFRILRKLKLLEIALVFQNWKVRSLFKQMRSKVPSVKFAVAGLGKKTVFPHWIEDRRVEKFDEPTERIMCQLYSDSRLVIGVHGSNMLLPSGHAGMTIDLMPEERWGNLTQDILYQETDPRLASFRYRYLPIKTTNTEVANIALDMLIRYSYFSVVMTLDQLPSKPLLPLSF